MTYHPPIYYTIRTLVRFMFYTGIALAIMWAFLSLAKDEKAYCNVKLNENFTWRWNGSPQGLDTCAHPELTILHDNFTYSWVQG